ncbi:MFS transporter [Actinoallomurus sp. CA-142502]|uniref:MFS transporter n=1 Tax=Actinoallomurus sp. CA-142502 TaxID=3239885 RepID=UPI003D8F2F49
MTGAGGRKWWALAAVNLCVLVVTLDGTVLSVALPELAKALSATESGLQWFLSGYLLTLAAGVLPAGLAGDRWGRKKVMLVSLAAFGAGSVLCAYAPSPGIFLTARLLMGFAGSGITVMAMSALTVLFDDRERGAAVGVYEVANFLALPAGPILGGWMLTHLWWGWVFLINVPVVAVGLIVGTVLVPESRATKRPDLDLTGMISSVIGLVVLTYGLIEAGERGWSAAVTLTTTAGGIAILGGFFAWERRLGGRGGMPMVDPALFRSRAFSWGAVLSGTAGLCVAGLLFSMPQYFQAVQGADAMESGLKMLPFVIGLVLGALPAGPLAKAAGARLTIALGFVLAGVGAGIGAVTSAVSATAFVVVWMAVLCAGVGLALTATTSVALSELSVERSGIGSAVVQTFQKTCAPLGSAVMGSVLAASYQARLGHAGLPVGAAPEIRHSVFSGLAIADRLGSLSLERRIRDAFAYGLDVSLLATAGIALTGLILTLTFAPRTRPAGHAGATIPDGAHAGRS